MNIDDALESASANSVAPAHQLPVTGVMGGVRTSSPLISAPPPPPPLPPLPPPPPPPPPPSLSMPSCRALSDLGLSARLVSAYERLPAPVCTLHEWQAYALGLDGVLSGESNLLHAPPIVTPTLTINAAMILSSGESNLLYTAPTSGGKTLVAEVLMWRRLEGAGQTAKVLFLVPFQGAHQP